MNISDISKASAPSGEVVPREARERSGESQNLAQVTDTASLSNLLPRLQNLLAAIDRPGDNVLEGISDNITRLQDAFVESLYNTASAEGVDFTRKLTLRLDEGDRLTVLGDHPDKERLETLLGGHPELSAAFKEISTQSELLRDVSNIGKIIGSQSGLAGYESALNRQIQANYQLSLKGEMSHFYFARC